MPWTAFVFLGGCVAISALPPLNGFASEWLMFQAMLLEPGAATWGLKLMVPAVGAMTRARRRALGGVLRSRLRHDVPRPAALAGRGRTRKKPTASRSPPCSLLLVLCFLAGILPGFVIDGIAPVAKGLVGQRMPVQSVDPVAVDRARGGEPELL